MCELCGCQKATSRMDGYRVCEDCKQDIFQASALVLDGDDRLTVNAYKRWIINQEV